MKQIEQGVDFFKIYGNLTKESHYSIAEISRAHGITFAGHIPIRLDIWEVIAAGQASIEHSEGILDASTSKPEEFASRFPKFQIFSEEAQEFLIETFDSAKFNALIDTLAISETWWTPTLTNMYMSSSHDRLHDEDSLFQYLPEHIMEWWKSSIGEPSEIRKKRFKFLSTLIGILEKRGVKILAGTDYPSPFCYPGFSLHDELNLLVQGGLSTSAALRTATINPTIFMKKENEFGLLKQNHLASMVLLNSNPLKDINNVRDIEGVFLRGQYLNRPALDSLLRSAKSIAANMQSPF
ncbi:MAG: amidohydrolase family protein [Fulvivirga sp.]|uniref:amidohydrolase family protein n=1 Tax=Fulvivirga sp. TaxID=1931237 RepID=UPI0032EEA2FA